MRGATGECWAASREQSCFNPRPSCEGRPGPLGRNRKTNMFQSAPLMRGATQWPASRSMRVLFQSAPLMRGATGDHRERGRDAGVSIRAPHARGDLPMSTVPEPETCFNPRPSCEGRPEQHGQLRHRPVSIRAPHARGDEADGLHASQRHVSIRAPHARGDRRIPTLASQWTRFNPRPSCEGRPERFKILVETGVFQSAPLMRGATVDVLSGFV